VFLQKPIRSVLVQTADKLALKVRNAHFSQAATDVRRATSHNFVSAATHAGFRGTSGLQFGHEEQFSRGAVPFDCADAEGAVQDKNRIRLNRQRLQ
jgi:hypothetical protein